MKRKLLYFTNRDKFSCVMSISCSDDYLNEKPYSSYAPETLTDDAGIEASLKGLHYTFGQLWTWSDQQGWLCLWQVGTDVASPGGIQGVEIPFFKYEDLNPENAGVNYMWSQCYRIINNANNALKAIGEEGDPAKIGEARFFRWLYLSYACNSVRRRSLIDRTHLYCQNRF